MGYNIQQSEFRRRKRLFLDKFAKHGVALGGISIIIAVALIFVYLLSVVLPIFSSADLSPVASYSIPKQESGDSLYLALEETGELGVRITSEGEAIFFTATEGKENSTQEIILPEEVTIKKVVAADAEGKLLGLLLSNNTVQIISIGYRVNFENDIKQIIPIIEYPYGEESVVLSEESIDTNTIITHLEVSYDEDYLALAAMTDTHNVVVSYFEVEEGDEIDLAAEASEIKLNLTADYMLMDPLAEWIFAVSETGLMQYYDISDRSAPELVGELQLVGDDTKLTDVKLLLGGLSLLVVDDKNRIRQWFMLRLGLPKFPTKYNSYIQELTTSGRLFFVTPREFNLEKSASTLIPEARRKGLLAINNAGDLQIYHTTADRHLITENLLSIAEQNNTKVVNAVLSPRSNAILLETDNGNLNLFSIDNPHPEISWQSLWGEVWYESYSQPDYIWQSSSADNDFEPKFSLIPLSFGTLKAAIYAMIIAIPLAILGAMYTAYFMSPKMRSLVKPSIEIMEALPTVILGFLAGLWLAPIVENNLLAVISLIIVMPLGLFFFAWVWHILPGSIRNFVPDGWQAALLMPVVIVLVVLSFLVAPGIENLFFDGNIIATFESIGIDYDQRNSLVVGIAMGLAVIPTIFSIAEDAIFSVPRHLSYGSLALGATPWQTLCRVVLLTASPGIFSAVMIGFGRAVGETMIVLMATGNTAIMDFNIFEGMRTLSANIAVELPESEVASSHFRILFLAALVLFAITFLLNTLAEMVRQRLRKRYSSL